jgi:palmitoyltransferase ZDHHC9/14/18
MTLQTLTLCLVIVTSALHLSMLTHEEQVKTFGDALGKGVGSAVAFCLAATVIWPVGALLVYHVRVSNIFFFSFHSIGRETHRQGLASLS